MQIRPATLEDLSRLADIDGTVESSRYLHLERSGEAPAAIWTLEDRPLRKKLIDPNRLSDDVHFRARQVLRGEDEGLALVAEYAGDITGFLLAQPRSQQGTLRIYELRVDYEQRRQGIGSAMLFQVIAAARERGLRAVSVETRTNNHPANAMLPKCAFELAGLDAQRESNHDVVKESATLLWYAALD